MGGLRIYIVVIAAVVLSGLAAMLPLAWSGADVLSSSYNEMAARELESNARLLSLAMPSGIDGKTREELGELIRAARADSDTRYTLVRRDGTVVADSDEDAGRMENHLNRPEIMRRDFVANVSHELRTPITAIQGSLETILDERSDGAETIAEFVEMALRNTKRMGAIIDNLLFLAGMESGSGKEAEMVGANPVLPAIDEAIALCGGDARSRKNSINADCDENLTALMNPQLVVHALVNLLDNAIKYGPEGGSVSVTARQGDDRVVITVSDQGPGIAPRHQSRVFERFYRVDGVPRVKKGSGLGLAIVKHIALAQGGDIRLESEIGTGSKFILSLPRA